MPYSSLESVVEHSKEGYYLALRQTQGTIRTEAPNWQPWLLFFLRALQRQKRHLAVKIEREKTALAALPELALKILDYVRDHGRVTTRDMVREVGASPNTLKTTFGSLVEKNLLVRHGGGRATWYGLRRGLMFRDAAEPAVMPRRAGSWRRRSCVGARVVAEEAGGGVGGIRAFAAAVPDASARFGFSDPGARYPLCARHARRFPPR